MSFTVYLAVIYLVLLIADVTAIVKKERGLAVVLTCIMAVGIVTLGWLWCAFPM